MHPAFYHIALTFIPAIGPILIKNLISYCGSAEAVFKEKKSKLLKIPGIGNKTADAITNQSILKKTEEEIDFIEQYKINAIPYTDKAYPSRLLHCHDNPIVLYQKGNTNLNAEKTLAIVGTRKATIYGKIFVEKLLEDLHFHDITVISGLAYGIDAAAHKHCLEENIKTIGVLGHGLNTIYPTTHKKLAKEMLANHGSLITEYSSQEKMMPSNFPKRNRIVAGMSDAVIVVESAIKGGAVITANIANTYNRDVFAVPGKTKDKYSAGCNFLIKTHKAALIESAKDLMYVMGWETQDNVKKKHQRVLPIDLPSKQQKIVNVLKEKEQVEIDELQGLTSLSSSDLAANLLELELLGIIHVLPGKVYELV